MVRPGILNNSRVAINYDDVILIKQALIRQGRGIRRLLY